MMNNAGELAMPLYLFPKVKWFKHLLIRQTILLEVCGNWQKQSPRTRYDIAGPNGKLQLVVPTQKSSRLLIKNVRVDYAENWQLNHWRSLESAYNRSPFFEFYRDDIKNFYSQKFDTLVALNLTSIKWSLAALKLNCDIDVTREYVGEFEILDDSSTTYPQVFDDKLGFIQDLSILDLIFNMGPDALACLR